MIILIASTKAVPIGCNDAANAGQTSARTRPITSPANICNGSARLSLVVPPLALFITGPSHGSYGIGGGADGAGEAQRRRGQEEPRAAIGAQPIGQIRQQPDLAEIDAELKEAMRVQWQRRAMILGAGARGMRLDRDIVGDEGDEPGFGHPVQQPLVA